MSKLAVGVCFGFATLLGLIGGCSDGGSGSGGGPGIGARDFAAGYCPLLEPCCDGAGLPAPAQGCQAFFGAFPPQDRQAAAECLDVYRERAKEATWCDESTSQERPEACARAWPQDQTGGTETPTGAAQLGEPCEETSDCAPSALGDAECSVFDDVCVVYAVVEEGEACIGERSENGTSTSGEAQDFVYTLCDGTAGHYCGFTGQVRTCAAFAELGAGCGSGERCVESGYCLDDLCTARGGPGTACSLFETDACDATTYCNEDMNSCQPLVENGGACRVSSDCQSSYCTGEACEESNLGGFGLILFCN